MTATELVNKRFPGNDGIFVLRNIEEFMIEFAKLKVTEALKAASNKAVLKKETFEFGFIGSEPVNYVIDKNSILNSYDLNDIK